MMVKIKLEKVKIQRDMKNKKNFRYIGLYITFFPLHYLIQSYRWKATVFYFLQPDIFNLMLMELML